MYIYKNHTNLETDLKIILSPSKKPASPNITTVYKYFKDKCAAVNFAENGIIWFPGVNQIRLFINRNDLNEYYSSITNEDNTSRCIIGGLHSLSLSKIPPEQWEGDENYYVKITDIPAFMNALYKDLPKHLHKISWLEKKSVLEQARKLGAVDQVLSIHSINHIPKEPLQLHVSDITLREMPYINDEQASAFIKAYNKDPVDSKESEIRLELHASSLLTSNDKNPEAVLDQLIQYIKCSCPSIKPYCLINERNL